MKRKVYRAKGDYDVNVDPDTYGIPEPPKPQKRCGFQFGAGKIQPGVYMQPNGQPVMIMPMIAGMHTPTGKPVPPAPPAPQSAPTKKKRK